MAVNINIPSQVKTYANLAAFPASGSLKTIYIAEDTNKTYRWTGSVYVEISASAAMTWGQIGGTLSNQTDLQNALDAKVPTSRTLTINGLAQDLSADRSWTISTGLTIGTTPISSGTIGRVLFQGTGNVLQQSSSLAYDDTTKAFTLSGSIGSGSAVRNSVTNTSNSGFADFFAFNDTGRYLGVQIGGSAATGTFANISNANISKIVTNNPFVIGTQNTNPLIFAVGASVTTGEVARFSASTGNFLINTTTDAGFRLDVNGTARVNGNFNIATGFELNFNNQNVGLYRSANNLRLGGFGGIEFLSSATTIASQTIRMTLFSTGNFAINTTTDAGFRLDVNGTARVSDNLLLTNGIIATSSATTRLQGALNYFTHNRIASSGIHGFQISNYGSTASFWRYDAGTGDIEFGNSTAYGVTFFANNLARTKMWSSGQWTMGSATAYNASALVAMESTTTGFLPPRMTNAQMVAIATPAAGLQVYDTTNNKMCVYDGTTWQNLY